MIRTITILPQPVQIHPTLSSVINIYRQRHIPLSILLEHYRIVRFNHEELERDAFNPYEYTQTMLLGNKSFETGCSIPEFLFDTQAFRLKNFLPTDVIKALFYSYNRNDSGCECSLVLQQLLNESTPDSRIIVINPSPDFILCFEKERIEANTMTTYAVSDQTLASLYSSQIQNCQFISFEKISSFHDFDVALIIQRDYRTEQIEKLIPSPSDDHNVKLIMFSSISAFDFSNTGLRKRLYHLGYLPLYAIRIPKGITVSKPKKKIFFTMSNNIYDTNGYFTYYDSHYSEETQLLTIDKSSKISILNYLSNIKLHNLFATTQSSDKPEIRTAPKEWFFSDEISLHYSVYENRGSSMSAIIHYKSTKLDKSCQIVRGSTLCGPSERHFSGKENSNINAVLTQTVLSDSYSTIISKNLMEEFSCNYERFCLKTIWYLSRDILLEKSHYDEQATMFLFSDSLSLLSGLKPAFAYERDYISALKKQLDVNDEEEIPLKYIEQISLILEAAIHTGIIEFNPIKYIVESRSMKATFRQSSAKNILSKKSFLDAEEERMLNTIGIGVKSYEKIFTDVLKNAFVLSNIIATFTGLIPEEISALTFDDFEYNHFYQIYSLKIHKISNKDGKISRNYDENTLYKNRRIPLVYCVSEIIRLLILHFEIKNIPKDVFLNAPIIPAQGNYSSILLAHKPRPALPSAIRSSLTAYICGSGVQPDYYLLPGAKKTIIADQNKLSVNILRNNFDYKSRYVCGMSPGSVCHILGLAPPDTISAHYCDYNSEGAQYSMYIALMRWYSKYDIHELDSIISVKQHIANQSSAGCFHGNLTQSTIISKAETTASISIHCENGSDCHITTYEE